MLRILSQRSDGYHELQTCFQILDWGDLLTFEQRQTTGDQRVSVEGVSGVKTEDNLIVRAAELLKPIAKQTSDWLVKVNKQIPMGGGLGGGSSNAATALKFLNQAWHCELSDAQLLPLAATLGADVPVFIAGQSCLATGIGEQLQPMVFDTPHILLLFPACQINTAALFADPLLNRNQVVLDQSLLQDPAYWINDFLPLVLQKYPAVDEVYQALRGAMRVRLSGSGSTMFAVFTDPSEAAAAQHFAKTVCKTRLVRPMKHGGR